MNDQPGLVAYILIIALPTLALVIARMRVRATQSRSKPYDSMITHKTQAVRRSVLYGAADVNPRPHKQETQ